MIRPFVRAAVIVGVTALDASNTLRALEQPDHSAAGEASKNITVAEDERN
ncbi:MAG: hypothetical protein ACOYXU_09530 [Nitrospirota bacterium]